MPYATLADLNARFGEVQIIQLTDRAGTGLVDEDVVDQALADASATIDGHLAGRYTLPLADTPAILVAYCCDLARYALYTDAVPEAVEKRHKDALAFLRMVGEGRLTLGAAPEPESDRAVQITTGRRTGSVGGLGIQH